LRFVNKFLVGVEE